MSIFDLLGFGFGKILEFLKMPLDFGDGVVISLWTIVIVCILIMLFGWFVGRIFK